MNPIIKIYCGKMKVYHQSRGLMLTSDQQDPPALWETTGPDGQPLGGPITFPATYVREKTLTEWWVDECVAEGAGQQGIVYPDCPGYFTGIGEMTMDACVAIGEVRWMKA